MSCLKKPILLIVISIFCFVIDTNAQVPQFGVKIGLNLSSVYGNDPDEAFPDRELKPGFVAGAYMTYAFLPLLSVQPEVLFSMKGTKGSYPWQTSPPSMAYTETFNYIEVPVLLKVDLPLGPAVPFKTSVYVGPDFAFNIASSEKITAPGMPSPLIMDTKSSVKNFDFNIAIGVGAARDLGPTTLGMELRYTLGTGALCKDPDRTPYDASVRNGVFAVIASVGI